MVKSGLDLNPYVSHFRLAVHLLIAQIILSFIVFLFIKRVTSQDYEKIRHFPFFIIFCIFSCSIFITVTYGAFMAGLDAGQSFNTWPKMGETFFPEGLFFVDEKFMGIFENSIFIHFFHRGSSLSLCGHYFNYFNFALQKNKICCSKNSFYFNNCIGDYPSNYWHLCCAQ